MVNTATVFAIIAMAATTTSQPMACGGNDRPDNGDCGGGNGDGNGDGSSNNDNNSGRDNNMGVDSGRWRD